MKINSPTIKEIIELQEKESIQNNKLLLFALAIDSNKATVVKTLQEELDLLEEELISFVRLLTEKDLLTKKDLEIISKLEKVKIIDRENFDKEVDEIINHLNEITETNRRITPKKKQLVEQWLKRGFSLDQFKMVNLYFHSKWSKDPEMSDYVKAETLYNTKFPSRVEDSENAFRNIMNYKDQINAICHKYAELFETIINKTQFTNRANLCSFMPFELQKKIVFWLSKNYTVDHINITLEFTLKDWSQKQELIPHINLPKILDSRFPERVDISMKKYEQSLALPNGTNTGNSGVDAVANWLEGNE